MRVTSILFLSLVSFAFACKKEAAQPAPPAKTASTAEAPGAANVLRGTVTEKIDASQYSYLKLKTGSGEVWTAVPKTDLKVGATAGVVGPIWMDNFKSSTLNRTWDRIAFGTLEGEPSPGVEKQMQAQPAGHPSGSPGMFASEAAGGSLPPGHPQPSAPADVGDVRVAKANGPQGRTIAEVYARKAALKGKSVTVRGKVVKATNGVLGKNWLHLRDGTGEGATADLAVASDATATVGQTVVVSGTVDLDRDLGAGYHYDVLVENAQIRPE